MRYIRLNSLVPELLDKVDAKQMGFMPAVEISYIRPENQRLIAVSIDGEQSLPLGGPGEAAPRAGQGGQAQRRCD